MGLFSGIVDAFFGGAEKKAADAQLEAARGQEAIQREGLDLIRPAIEAGDQSRNLLLNALGVNGPEAQQDFFSNFQSDPGFQASVDFGIDAVKSQASALGGLKSGGTLKALAETAERRRGASFSNRINQLLALSGAGQTAAGTAQVPISGIAGAIGNQGQARASGFIGQANAITNTFNQAANLGARVIGGFNLPGTSGGTGGAG